MHRACRIGVVGHRVAIGQLERTGRQRADIGDALIGGLRGLAGATGEQELVVLGRQAGFRLLRQHQRGLAGGDRRAAALVRDVGDLGTADQRSRQLILREVLLRRAQQECIVRAVIHRRVLMRLFEVRPGDRILAGVELDDALREQVEHALAVSLGHVGREHVVEAAVLADDDDHVLDRRTGLVSTVVIPVLRKDGAGGELAQRQCAEGEAATLQPT